MCIAVGNVSFEDCGHIYVVVGMNRFLAAENAAGDLDRSIRDDFVAFMLVGCRCPSARRAGEK